MYSSQGCAVCYTGISYLEESSEAAGFAVMSGLVYQSA